MTMEDQEIHQQNYYITKEQWKKNNRTFKQWKNTQENTYTKGEEQKSSKIGRAHV